MISGKSEKVSSPVCCLGLFITGKSVSSVSSSEREACRFFDSFEGEGGFNRTRSGREEDEMVGGVRLRIDVRGAAKISSVLERTSKRSGVREIDTGLGHLKICYDFSNEKEKKE